MILTCLFACVVVVFGPAIGCAEDRAEAKPSDKPLRVLVFSRVGWYRHPEIPRTNGWLVRLGQEQGFTVDVTEKPRGPQARSS